MPKRRLPEYEAKRDFSVTPEPAPGAARRSAEPTFVVHKHDASRLHYDVRLEIVRVLNELLRAEEKMDQRVRQKILSQKRQIVEGSQEWDILYRKYYSEEMKKLGLG